MFIFVENLAGLYITSRSTELSRRRLLKFISPYIYGYSAPAFLSHGWVIVLPRRLMRVLKPALSLLQFPVVQQDPMSWAFRLSLWKAVLSDGLLTEYLVRQLHVPARRFYSLRDVSGDGVAVVPGCAIIGANWMEFGCMSIESYRGHLRFLQRRYPEATYFCHPRELNRAPEEVFGANSVRRPDRPIELLLMDEGIPGHLVGVCSSSLLALPAGNAHRVRVDLVDVPQSRFDGPRGAVIETLKRPINGQARITVQQLQHFLLGQLAELRVATHQVTEPVYLPEPT